MCKPRPWARSLKLVVNPGANGCLSRLAYQLFGIGHAELVSSFLGGQKDKDDAPTDWRLGFPQLCVIKLRSIKHTELTRDRKHCKGAGGENTTSWRRVVHESPSCSISVASLYTFRLGAFCKSQYCLGRSSLSPAQSLGSNSPP